ncbi:MAG: NAD(P)H-dependent oxidoreductase [Nanobdellota archaeon]
MNILVILGHPDEETLCGTLMQRYAAGARKGGARVKTLNLGELSFDPILHKGYKEIQELEPDLVHAQKLITWADHLVFVYPNWWASFPALLSGFFDRVILPGFAFNYTGKYAWKKYLKGKTARLIVTMGGPALFYRFILGAPGHKVMRASLHFCGVKPVRSTVFGLAADVSAKRAKKMKERVYRVGIRDA